MSKEEIKRSIKTENALNLINEYEVDEKEREKIVKLLKSLKLDVDTKGAKYTIEAIYIASNVEEELCKGKFKANVYEPIALKNNVETNNIQALIGSFIKGAKYPKNHKFFENKPTSLEFVLEMVQNLKNDVYIVLEEEALPQEVKKVKVAKKNDVIKFTKKDIVIKEEVIVVYLQKENIPDFLPGYNYLKEAIVFALENPELIDSRVYEIYKLVAQKHNTPIKKIQHRIKRAVDYAMVKKNRDAWEEGDYYNINKQINEKPTPRKLIRKIVCEYLKEYSS